MGLFFNQTLSMMFIVMAIIASCASNEITKNQNKNTLEELSVDKKIVYKFTNENSEKIFISINEKMKYKRLFLYNDLFSRYEEIIENKCRRLDESKITSPNIYQNYVQANDLDNPISFLFFKNEKNDPWVKGFRCDFLEELVQVEIEYYLCNKKKTIQECFVVSLIQPSSKLPPKYYEVIRKKASRYICEQSKEACDVYELLTNSKYVKEELKASEVSLSQKIYSNGGKGHINKTKLEIKEKELVEKNEKREMLQQEIAEKSIQRKKDSCENGNDNVCWELYVILSKDNLEDGAYFLNKACDYGNEKACIVVKNKRDEINSKEQNRISREANAREQSYRDEQERQRQADEFSKNYNNYLKSVNKSFNNNADKNKRKCTTEMQFGQLVTKCENE